jgi:seryl-tRNA(Sec) selenium transferase
VVAVERKLRAADPPVIARIQNNRLLLDLRTVFESEEPALLRAIQAYLE